MTAGWPWLAGHQAQLLEAEFPGWRISPVYDQWEASRTLPSGSFQVIIAATPQQLREVLRQRVIS